MKTLEEAKKILRLCNAKNSNWGKRRNLWLGYACPLCSCCPECNTLDVIHWVWPELIGYNKMASEEEWLAWAKTDKDNPGLTEEEKRET